MKVRTLPVETLLDQHETETAGDWIADKGTQAKRTFQAVLSSTVTPAATVIVEGSNDGVNPITLGTITISGAEASDGFAVDAAWSFYRGRVSSITGSHANITLTMGG